MADENMPLSRDTVRAILAEFPVPDAIVGTRAAREQADWHRNEGRSLDHKHWAIRTKGKRSGGRDRTYTLSFDSVIDVGGVTLADDRFLEDVLTHKLVCLAVLNNACRRRYTATGLRRLCLLLDWHVRYRLSVGVERNAGLTPEHFSDYVKRLQEPGIAHLVPIEKRIQDFSERDRADRDWQSADLRPKLCLEQVACELGVTAESFVHAPELRALLVEALGKRIDLATAPPERTGCKGTATARQAGRSAWGIAQNLNSWIMLADLSQQGLLEHDPLPFDPFADQRESAVWIAKRNGSTTSRVTIAPPYFLQVMRAAATWVTGYSGPILKAVALMREDPALHGSPGDKGRQRIIRLAKSEALDQHLPEGMPLLLLSWKTSTGWGCELTPRMSLTAAVSHLMTACLILIAGLGARSIEETLGLKAGCVTEREPGLFELSIYAAGTLQGIDAMPVPGVVAAAVRVLEQLTARTRSANAEQYIFRYMRDFVPMDRGPKVSRRAFVQFPKPRYLQDFVATSGVLAVDPETLAWLSGSQLKSGFAVAYYFVVPGAPIDALSRCLGQFDPEVTRRYVYGTLAGQVGRLKRRIDAEVATHRAASGDEGLEELRALLRDLEARQGSFERLRCEAFVARAQGILAGVDVPGGAGGRKLVEDLEVLAREIQTRVRLGGRNDPDAAKGPLISALEDFSRKRQLDLVPGAAAHCTYRPHGPSDLAEAECEKRRLANARPWAGALGPDASDGLPDHAHASLSACFECIYGAVFADDRRRGENECERLSYAARRAAGLDSRLSLEEKLSEFRSKLAAATPRGMP